MAENMYQSKSQITDGLTLLRRLCSENRPQLLCLLTNVLYDLLFSAIYEPDGVLLTSPCFGRKAKLKYGLTSLRLL